MILFESLKVYSEVAVIEYIEIMLENFPLGEAAVCIQAPLGMLLCSMLCNVPIYLFLSSRNVLKWSSTA